MVSNFLFLFFIGQADKDADASFVKAPDPNRFYWDYAKNEEIAGWGRVWRGKNMDKCVKCMLRERRRNMLDAKFDDTYFLSCNYGGTNGIPIYNTINVQGPQAKLNSPKCNVMMMWCPGDGKDCWNSDGK